MALLRLLSLYMHPINKCPVNNCSLLVAEDSVCSYIVLSDHTSLDISTELCIDALINCSDEICV